jgi:hypothetical protein
MQKLLRVETASRLIAFLALVWLVTGIAACAPEVTTFPRPLSHQVEDAITNAIPVIVQVSHGFLPQPWPDILQAIGALSLAALAVWQAKTHSQVIDLSTVAKNLHDTLKK